MPFKIIPTTEEQDLSIYAEKSKMFYPDNQYGGILTTNWSTLAVTGFYSSAVGATGAPDSDHSWFGWHLNSNIGTSYAHQILWRYGNVDQRIRYKSDGVWSAWALGPATFVGIADAGSYYTGTTVEAALQEAGVSISQLNTQLTSATNVIYVDNKRTDTYTAVGTYNLPFKTIQAAMDSITGNSSSNRFCIKIATGAVYTEALTINKDYLTLEGYGDTILSGNLTFETTALHVKFRYLKLTGNASGTYTSAFVIDVCDCNTEKNKNWVFSCSVSGAFIQVSGQSTLWYANFVLTNIKGVIANQGGYFEGTHTFNECNGEFIGFENYGGTININAGSEIYIGASMCIDTVVNLAEGATLHIDAISASKLATLNNNGGTLDLTTPSSAIHYDNTASGLIAETVKSAIDEIAATLDGLDEALEALL